MSVRAWVRHSFNTGQRVAGRVRYRMGLLRERPGGPVPVFVLHAVSDAPSDMAVGQVRFREQLGALADAGYRCAPLSEVVDEGETGADDLRYVLTFDDGYDSVLDPGLEILEQADAHATLFLAVDFLDGSIAPPWRSTDPALLAHYRDNADFFRPLEWAAVKELAASGRIEIGSHTLSHPLVGSLSPEQQRKEVLRSKDILEDRLGLPIRYFSYPFGVRRYGAYSDASEVVVKDAGYLASCTSEIGRKRTGSGSYLIPRMPLVSQDTRTDVLAKAAGAYDWVHVAQVAYQYVFPNPH